MKLQGTGLDGVALLVPDLVTDERGYFARVFDVDVLAAAGLVTDFAHHSLSYNTLAGTLRGLHFQQEPFAETKIVRCTRGSVMDVAVDVRLGSSTFGAWTSVELSAQNALALYVPSGFAHGFQTLEPDTELLYLIDVPYRPSHSTGVRWDDATLGITWPSPPSVLSPRDAELPSLDSIGPPREERA